MNEWKITNSRLKKERKKERIMQMRKRREKQIHKKQEREENYKWILTVKKQYKKEKALKKFWTSERKLKNQKKYKMNFIEILLIELNSKSIRAKLLEKEKLKLLCTNVFISTEVCLKTLQFDFTWTIW